MSLLYKKLSNPILLKKAWHLARMDTRSDFIEDSFKYNDFAFYLDKNIELISNAINKEEYHPNPILHIDIPKSSLSVRPGSIISIEDRIVLFAIILLIAERLDNQLPKNVYSYRLKKSNNKDTLFNNLEILKFPFLKRRTIQRRINIIEPWYGQYPKFIQDTIAVYENEGYNFLTISDVSSYFENINLELLRELLLEYFPKDQKLMNLLYAILKYWTWPSTSGININRGIPQGNDISSFLGNIYLLPLDKEFKKYELKNDVKYFRYVDDVKIFSREEKVAREIILIMNNILRKIHLNIQGSKTIILEGKEIYNELYDDRINNVNKVIDNTQKKGDITDSEYKKHIQDLICQYKKIEKRGNPKGKELKLYLRILTGFSLLQNSYLVNRLLRVLRFNPDSRLLKKSVTYLRNFPRSSKKIERDILDFLKSPINLFPYQEAKMIETLRYLPLISINTKNYLKKKIRSNSTNWYIKVQSYLLLSVVPLTKRFLISLQNKLSNSQNVEISKPIIKCLCQLDESNLKKLIEELVFDPDSKKASIGRMFSFLIRNKENSADKAITEIFNNFDENNLMEFYYKIDIIKFCNSELITKRLKTCLKKIKRKLKKEHLKKKVNLTLEYLKINREK